MGGLHEISGQCHCGNIRYLLTAPIPKLELPLRGCDCSFCSRQGAVYTSHPQARLDVSVTERDEVSFYRFGNEQADVFLCAKCGVFPFVVTEIDNSLYAVLNANSISGLHIDRSKVLTTPHLEKQTTEERVARWQRAWIPHVVIHYRNTSVNPAIL